MSEPVGNASRNPGDIPGNAHKDREKAVEKAKNEPEREPAEQIVTGKVVTRKPPWYKRLGHSLLADDATSIGDFVLTDVIGPAVRNLIRDIVVGGTDRALYGTSKIRGGRMGEGRGSLRTRYDLMSRDEPEPRRVMSRDARARHDFDDVVLEEREVAIRVVEALIDRVERYRFATVADLYDFLGVTGSYADRNWGWTDLRDADVRQSRGGWLLDLPRPEHLR